MVLHGIDHAQRIDTAAGLIAESERSVQSSKEEDVEEVAR